MAVTPVQGTNVTVPTGGVAVQVFPPSVLDGSILTNPYTATEPLFVDPVGAATLTASGTTFALQPGQDWRPIAGQSTQTTVNATTTGHPFSAIYVPGP